jgi:hypothetical protein
MKVSERLASCRTRTPRALAFVLLIGIVYGVTFGSAHSHSITSSDTGTTAITKDAARASSPFLIPTHELSHQQECLICLFHQQLFSSVVHAPLYVVRPSILIEPTSSPRVFFHSSSFTSTVTARFSGRAPPTC